MIRREPPAPILRKDKRIGDFSGFGEVDTSVPKEVCAGATVMKGDRERAG